MCPVFSLVVLVLPIDELSRYIYKIVYRTQFFGILESLILCVILTSQTFYSIVIIDGGLTTIFYLDFFPYSLDVFGRWKQLMKIKYKDLASGYNNISSQVSGEKCHASLNISQHHSPLNCSPRSNSMVWGGWPSWIDTNVTTRTIEFSRQWSITFDLLTKKEVDMWKCNFIV